MSMAMQRCSSVKRKKYHDSYDDDSSKRSKMNDEANLLVKNNTATSYSRLRRCSTRTNNHTRTLQTGDRVNLSKLLFPKHRDHLITYKDRNRPVYISDLFCIIIRICMF